MHRIKEKTLKQVYINFFQPELKLKKCDIFAKIKLKKIHFSNSNLNSDLLKQIELKLELKKIGFANSNLNSELLKLTQLELDLELEQKSIEFAALLWALPHDPRILLSATHVLKANSIG